MSTAERLEQLWHAADRRELNALVDSLDEDEAQALVMSIDLSDVPLNAFCTDAFIFNGLDDRMVAITLLALRLLETSRKSSLMPLLDALARKSEEKIRRGPSNVEPSFESSDPWRFGESLMLETHTLAIELLKSGDYDRAAASLLEALLLDYPDRLESRFWLAAARHNLYLEGMDPESKQRALRAIDAFIDTAGNDPAYRQNVEALRNLRSSKY